MIPVVFEEVKDYERGFAAHFDRHIAPLLSDLEAFRKQKLQDFIVACIVSAVVVAAVMAMVWIPQMPFNIQSDDKAGIVIMTAMLILAWPISIYTRYRQHAKGKILPHILSFWKGIKYHEGEGIDARDLAPFHLLPSHEIYQSEDYISGQLDGVDVSLGEVHLKVRVRTKNGTRERTVFRGIAVLLQVHKPFKGRTVIRRDAGMLGNLLQGAVGSLDRVTLEDPRFEKQFEVYSSDQVEARYLLTTAFMERLMLLGALMKRWGSDPTKIDEAAILAQAFSQKSSVQGSFLNGRLMLLVPCSRNLFEPGSLFKPATHLAEIRCVLYQAYLIGRIIDVLKLDQKIGL